MVERLPPAVQRVGRDGLGQADDRSAFAVATDLVAGDPVSQLAKSVVSYPLHRWREALDHAHTAGRLGTVKVAFDPRSTR